MQRTLNAALLFVLLVAGCSSQHGELTQAGLAGPGEVEAADPVERVEPPEPAAKPEPEIAMDCPADEDSQDGERTFQYSINAVEPYAVDIDYGDGDRYGGTQDNLDVVFQHEYEVPGEYDVTATVTDANGNTEYASCAFTWTALAEAPPYFEEYEDDSSYGACGYDEYENVDGECISRPGDDPRGATARCNDGTYSYSQNRRGTCSGHGGVAVWY